MARKSKLIKSPAQIEAERLKQERKAEDARTKARIAELTAVGLQPEAARLVRQAEIAVTRAGGKRDGQKVDGDSARRMDAFEALKAGMAQGCYDACRRFEMDVLIRRGEGDRGRPMTRVDHDMDPDYAQALKRAAAAERIEAVVARLPPRDWWLLMELIAPRIDRGGWRETVEYITGESHTHAQGAVVRAVSVNLRDAYTAMERKAAA